MENERLIQQYENGSLSASEKMAFEKRLGQEPSLAHDVKEFKDLKAAIKLNEQEDLKKTLLDLDAQDQETPLESEETISFSKKYRHIYAAAAVIIFAIIAFQFLQNDPSNQDLYASFYQPYPNTLQPVVRGGNTQDNITQAFIAYEANQFDKAAQLFEKSLSEKYDADVAFYQAMSLLSSDQEEKSLKILSNLKSTNTSYKPQLYWYSALIALRDNDNDRTLEQLDSLALLKSDYKKSAVAKLQKQLKD